MRRWLWSVNLADALRALITAGRWHDAHTHLQRHHGIGHRLLDALQVAVIAALTAGVRTRKAVTRMRADLARFRARGLRCVAQLDERARDFLAST